MSREIAALNAAWGWAGVAFAEEIAHSLMGHMLVTDTDGAFHYVDPDLGTVTRLGNEAAAQAHMDKPETAVVWRARDLVNAAIARLGDIAPGEVYSLTLPAMIEGDYAPENLVRIDLVRLLHLTGDLARQVRDLPDGASVNIKVVE